MSDFVFPPNPPTHRPKNARGLIGAYYFGLGLFSLIWMVLSQFLFLAGLILGLFTGAISSGGYEPTSPEGYVWPVLATLQVVLSIILWLSNVINIDKYKRANSTIIQLRRIHIIPIDILLAVGFVMVGVGDRIGLNWIESSAVVSIYLLCSHLWSLGLYLLERANPPRK